MKKQLLQSAKVIVLALVIGLGVSYLSAAWTGPGGNPPGNNAPAPLNVTTTNQAKGGNPFAGSLLDIAGIFSASHIAVGGQLVVGDTIKGMTLVNTETDPVQVCADQNGVLVLCTGSTPPSGAFTQVYTLTGSGQTTSGPCVSCTSTTFVNPVTQQVTIRVWGAGGGGGAGSKPNSTTVSSVREPSGGSGGKSLFSGPGMNLTADMGVGGTGGRVGCANNSTYGQCGLNGSVFTWNGSGGSGGSAGAGGTAGGNGLDADIGAGNPSGGAGGGGGAGQYIEQTTTLAQGTYTVTVGKGGSAGMPASNDSGYTGRKDPCTSGAFLWPLVKTAHAAPLLIQGGLGGTSANNQSHTAGRGGDGGSTSNCGTGTGWNKTVWDAGIANGGIGGSNGRVEVSWTQ